MVDKHTSTKPSRLHSRLKDNRNVGAGGRDQDTQDQATLLSGTHLYPEIDGLPLKGYEQWTEKSAQCLERSRGI